VGLLRRPKIAATPTGWVLARPLVSSAVVAAGDPRPIPGEGDKLLEDGWSAGVGRGETAIGAVGGGAIGGGDGAYAAWVWAQPAWFFLGRPGPRYEISLASTRPTRSTLFVPDFSRLTVNGLLAVF
jgi:hypothetical protein